MGDVPRLGVVWGSVPRLGVVWGSVPRLGAVWGAVPRLGVVWGAVPRLGAVLGGGVTPLRAPTPLCQNRVCLTRGVSPGAYRGAQGRSLKNTWKMFVFNCMIHFVTCIVTIFPITELLGYP